MNKKNNLLFFVAIIIAFISLLSIGFLLGSIYQQRQDQKDECGVSDKTHTVTISRESFHPKNITATRCDKLVFYNQDDRRHSVVFGTFENHLPYGEFITEYLLPKERISLKLFKTGVYLFHDHTSKDLKGQLTIESE